MAESDRFVLAEAVAVLERTPASLTALLAGFAALRRTAAGHLGGA